MSGKASIRLPAVLDLSAAAPLKASFEAVKGQDVEVDGADVERMGGLCLQVLIAARMAYASEGRDFSIVNPSAALTASIALMGGATHLGLAA